MAEDAARIEFNERAKTRLRIAARFLRQRGCEFPKDGDFYSQVLRALDTQPDKDALRELVDWLEQYEAAESKPVAKDAVKSSPQRVQGNGS